MIKILFFGDIVGKIGRQGLVKAMPDLKADYNPDCIIANIENLAHGTGATKKTLGEIQTLGIHCFTSGNHIFDKKKDLQDLIQSQNLALLRPGNYPPGVEGKGEAIIKTPGGKSILVLHLLGRVFFKETLDCPFRKADEILGKYKDADLDAILVDFHAEATSEKVAFGHYLDGRATAIFGTHTHIPTADEKITPLGTAYISDVGMVGAKDSVIGVAKQGPIKQFLTQTPASFEIPENGTCLVNGVIITIDEATKKATSIKRVYQEVEV